MPSDRETTNGRPAANEPRTAGRPITLAIDVGGSRIKAARLGPDRQLVGTRVRFDTPEDLTPASLLDSLVRLAESFDEYDRVSVGINGLVHRGRIYAIPMTANPAFRGLDLAETLGRRLGCPVRVLNDAQMHGLGFVRGQGVEVAITLGTGLGSELFIDGTLGPHLQFLPDDVTLGDNSAALAGGVRMWEWDVQ